DFDSYVRQPGVGIELGDFWVVPRADFAEEDVGENRSAEADAGSSGQIVDHGDTDEDRGQLDDRMGSIFQLLFGYGSVSAAKIAVTGEDANCAFRGAFWQVAHLHIGMRFVILIAPSDIERLGQAGAGGYERDGALRRCRNRAHLRESDK